MKKALRLATATGLSVLLLFGVIINDDIRGSSRRWTFINERHGDAATEEVSIEDDSFAGRRRHLDSVCDKYDDIYRPEYYNLYREVNGGRIFFAMRYFEKSISISIIDFCYFIEIFSVSRISADLDNPYLISDPAFPISVIVFTFLLSLFIKSLSYYRKRK
jgi:hypothetical protein